MHGRKFVVKCGGDSLVWSQWSHQVDAEVKSYKCRFLVLFIEVFQKQD